VGDATTTLTKLTSGGQLTLPKEIRKKVNMQPCYFVEVILDEEGRIVPTPKKLIDASQAYFRTKERQEAEREADEDIKAGRGKKFRSGVEAARYLKEKYG
jgi:AbrB family looped-hinge helix DNA binding protein